MKNFTTWVCSADWFNSLTAEQQQWLVETVEEAGEYNNQVQEAADKEYLQLMKDEGVTVVEPSEEVLKGFKEKAQAFYTMGDRDCMTRLKKQWGNKEKDLCKAKIKVGCPGWGIWI